MSIMDYRKALDGIPGAERLIMNYGRDGDVEVQVFSIDDLSVRVCATAGPAEVKRAFLDVLKE